MHRLFVAIRPPTFIRTHLLAIMGGIVGARWQNDDQLHITLRFIGEVDRHRADDIADSLENLRFTAFDIALSGLGYFDRKGQVDALWVGVQPRAPLAHLHHKIDRACIQAGLAPETRAYIPHITIARFGRTGGDVSPFIAHHAAFASAPFPVEQFILFESILGREGPAYHAIAHYPADDAGAQPFP